MREYLTISKRRLQVDICKNLPGLTLAREMSYANVDANELDGKIYQMGN